LNSATNATPRLARMAMNKMTAITVGLEVAGLAGILA
jgi:hypothetical protein